MPQSDSESHVAYLLVVYLEAFIDREAMQSSKDITPHSLVSSLPKARALLDFPDVKWIFSAGC